MDRLLVKEGMIYISHVIHTHTHMHTHIYKYTHTHTHTHTHTQSGILLSHKEE